MQTCAGWLGLPDCAVNEELGTPARLQISEGRRSVLFRSHAMLTRQKNSYDPWLILSSASACECRVRAWI